VVIYDHHPGYISWDTFTANQRQLSANQPQRGARPPREGLALLKASSSAAIAGQAWASPTPALTPPTTGADPIWTRPTPKDAGR